MVAETAEKEEFIILRMIIPYTFNPFIVERKIEGGSIKSGDYQDCYEYR